MGGYGNGGDMGGGGYGKLEVFVIPYIYNLHKKH